MEGRIAAQRNWASCRRNPARKRFENLSSVVPLSREGVRRQSSSLRLWRGQTGPDLCTFPLLSTQILQKFLKELNAMRLAQRFESHHQLYGMTLYSLMELRKSDQRPGYVRADELRASVEAEHAGEFGALKQKVEEQTEDLEDSAREYHKQKEDWDHDVRATKDELQALRLLLEYLPLNIKQFDEAMSVMAASGLKRPSMKKLENNSFREIQARVEQSGYVMPVLCPDCGGNGQIIVRRGKTTFQNKCERCEGAGILQTKDG
jgi:ribosomal protein S27E